MTISSAATSAKTLWLGAESEVCYITTSRTWHEVRTVWIWQKTLCKKYVAPNKSVGCHFGHWAGLFCVSFKFTERRHKNPQAMGSVCVCTTCQSVSVTAALIDGECWIHKFIFLCTACVHTGYPSHSVFIACTHYDQGFTKKPALMSKLPSDGWLHAICILHPRPFSDKLLCWFFTRFCLQMLEGQKWKGNPVVLCWLEGKDRRHALVPLWESKWRVNGCREVVNTGDMCLFYSNKVNIGWEISRNSLISPERLWGGWFFPHV